MGNNRSQNRTRGRDRSWTLKQAFEIYASKAPVNNVGPQIKAHKAFGIVGPLLTDDERAALTVAVGRALGGEGRGEFDAACQRIRSRLFTEVPINEH